MPYLKWILQPLALFAIGLLFVINITLYVFWYLPGIQNLNQSLTQFGSSVARSLAFEATTALHNDDRATISHLLSRFADQDGVHKVTITAHENNLRFNSPTPLNQLTGRLFNVPIIYGNETLGEAEVIISERQLMQWTSQALSSWAFFNIINIIALVGFIYWRAHYQHQQWNATIESLSKHIPELKHQLSGAPEQQISQLVSIIEKPLETHARLVNHLQDEGKLVDTDRLINQLQLVDHSGYYTQVTLVSVVCQNWEALIRHYDAPILSRLWRRYEDIMLQVSELYGGTLLPDGFTLAYGLSDHDQVELDAINSARVLHLSLNAPQHQKLQPIFGIAVSSGAAFISKTNKHGLALPLVTGDADTQLNQIKAVQPHQQVLFGEPLLQNQDVNDHIDASHYQDITLRDGSRFEVWELDGVKNNDDLLHQQAITLFNQAFE